jgi:hypothetical protein
VPGNAASATVNRPSPKDTFEELIISFSLRGGEIFLHMKISKLIIRIPSKAMAAISAALDAIPNFVMHAVIALTEDINPNKKNQVKNVKRIQIFPYSALIFVSKLRM